MEDNFHHELSFSTEPVSFNTNLLTEIMTEFLNQKLALPNKVQAEAMAQIYRNIVETTSAESAQLKMVKPLVEMYVRGATALK
jgi:hypothetical protein